MSSETTTPITWVVDGNLTPSDLILLESTAPFSDTNSDTTITVEQEIDGHTLKAVRVTPNFEEA